MTAERYFALSANFPPGSNDVAQITLRAGQQVMSRLLDTQTQSSRDYFRASATSLALWFADNWWRLRWETLGDPRYASAEWRIRHELSSAVGGAVLPPVMIYSSSDRIVFEPSFRRNKIAGPQQYMETGVAMVLAAEYEAELDRFFETVINHCARSVDGSALTAIVQQIAAERSDPELAGWRRLEACLGFDADLAPDDVINGLINLEDVAGADGVEEAARAQPGEYSARVLQQSIDATRASTVEVDLDIVARVQLDRDLPKGASPWKFAAAAARDLRQIIGVRKGKMSNDELADLLGSRWSDLKDATATARDLSYGARLVGDRGDAALSLQTIFSVDRRFELARTIGDAIWQGSSSFGVISRAKTDRQKFQRAFAHDFLCPIDDLAREMDVLNPNQAAIEGAAKTFHVRPAVVRNQLVYKGYIPFENSSEEAEAA